MRWIRISHAAIKQRAFLHKIFAYGNRSKCLLIVTKRTHYVYKKKKNYRITINSDLLLSYLNEFLTF